MEIQQPKKPDSTRFANNKVAFTRPTYFDLVYSPRINTNKENKEKSISIDNCVKPEHRHLLVIISDHEKVVLEKYKEYLKDIDMSNLNNKRITEIIDEIKLDLDTGFLTENMVEILQDLSSALKLLLSESS